MKYDKYIIYSSSSSLKFEFYSEGPRGKVRKQVIFKAFDRNQDVFNLGFGDVEEDGEINDLVITNNQDSQKVLATVALTVFKFFERYPNAYVFITGSTVSRTRLYRIGISNNLNEIRNDFNVYGFIEESWETFQVGIDYKAFLIKKKRK